MIQGLIIFLTNNSHLSRVAQLDADSFNVTNKTAINICAFLAGLRFRRTMMHSSDSWSNLRQLHILSATAGFNQWPTDLNEHKVYLFDDHLKLDGIDYFPEKEVFVLDLPLDTFVHVHSKSGDQIYSNVHSIAFNTRKTLRLPKYVEFIRPKASDHIAVLNSFNFTKKKGRLVATRFSNKTLDDSAMDVRIALQFKIAGTAYITNQDGSSHQLVNGEVALWPKVGKKIIIRNSQLSQEYATQHDELPLDQMKIDFFNVNPKQSKKASRPKLKEVDLHKLLKARQIILRSSNSGMT